MFQFDQKANNTDVLVHLLWFVYCLYLKILITKFDTFVYVVEADELGIYLSISVY